MTNMISGAELHAAEASGPLRHHPSATSESVPSFAAIHLILETILVLQ